MKNSIPNKLKVHLKELVYGGVDGIVTTFAVVAGFNGAQIDANLTTTFSTATVLLFGIANLFADGVSMSLGNFLSLRSEKDVYRQFETREKKELRDNEPAEIAETKKILTDKGFSAKDTDTLTDIYRKYPDYWLSFMMTHEIGLPNPSTEVPHIDALVTFSSFVLFGSIPLLPYLFFQQLPVSYLFWGAIGGSVFALIILGSMRHFLSGEKLKTAIVEVLGLGSIAGMVAYFVGVFFRG